MNRFQKHKSFVSGLFVLLWAVLAVVPTWIFVQARGGFKVFDGTTPAEFGLILFPLVGLYAFYFIWWQIILGSNLDWLRPRIRWIEKFHRTEGAFALLFALLHLLLLVGGVGFEVYWAKGFVGEEMIPYVWLGQIQLLLLCATVGTALLMRRSGFRRIWRKLHYINYVIFGMVWVHSWWLGSDVRHTELKYLWIAFGITAVATLVRRVVWGWRSQLSPSSPLPPALVQVATVAELESTGKLCVAANGRKLALFSLKGKYYAIDNTCPHAGGPLCEGGVRGEIVTCPWHGSQFSIPTGEVITGPATQPVRTYPVSVEDGVIKVAMSTSSVL